MGLAAAYKESDLDLAASMYSDSAIITTSHINPMVVLTVPANLHLLEAAILFVDWEINHILSGEDGLVINIIDDKTAIASIRSRSRMTHKTNKSTREVNSNQLITVGIEQEVYKILDVNITVTRKSYAR